MKQICFSLSASFKGSMLYTHIIKMVAPSGRRNVFSWQACQQINWSRAGRPEWPMAYLVSTPCQRLSGAFFNGHLHIVPSQRHFYCGLHRPWNPWFLRTAVLNFPVSVPSFPSSKPLCTNIVQMKKKKKIKCCRLKQS